MLSIILIYLIISVGSLAGIIAPQCRYEKMLPVTCMSLMVVLLLFGLAGALKAGFYFVLVICALAYICFFAAAGFYIRRDGWSGLLSRLKGTVFTVPGLIFACFYIFAVYANYDNRVFAWDECSHWALVVKEMTFLDVLSTDSRAVHVMFRSYPPAMALLQYLFERTAILCDPVCAFSERHLFLAYQVFLYSYIFPFFSRANYKKISAYIMTAVALAAPLLIFKNTLWTLYIDPFLGIVSGAGLAALFTEERKNALSNIYVLLTAFTLVLIKDAGIMFAAFLVVGYGLLLILDMGSSRITRKRGLILLCLAVVCVAAPKLLWDLSIQLNGTPKSFSQKFDMAAVIGTITGNNPDPDLASIAKEFFAGMKSADTIQILNLSVSPNATLALLFIGLVCAYLVCIRVNPEKKADYLACFLVVSIQTLVYILGLIMVYRFKLCTKTLLSFDRYIGIALNALWMCSLLTLMDKCRLCKKLDLVISIAFACFAVLTHQHSTVRIYVERSETNYSTEAYQYADPYFEHILSATQENDSICLIYQVDNGFYHYFSKYNLLPRFVSDYWCVGSPAHEGEEYIKILTPEEWKEDLKDNYDYVALYEINEAFCEEFEEVFENPEDITALSLFRVDKTSGMLRVWPEEKTGG